jgi:hypothetical protein
MLTRIRPEEYQKNDLRRGTAVDMNQKLGVGLECKSNRSRDRADRRKYRTIVLNCSGRSMEDSTWIENNWGQLFHIAVTVTYKIAEVTFELYSLEKDILTACRYAAKIEPLISSIAQSPGSFS